MRAKRAENFWIYKRFLGQFSKKKKLKKKIHPTDRPLFEICSPVEQGFFFSWPNVGFYIALFAILIKALYI